MKNLSQDIFMGLLVSAIILAMLSLSACGKQDEIPNPICVEDPAPFEFHYASDAVGVTHKSSKSTCSNGCTTVKALDTSNLSEEKCN